MRLSLTQRWIGRIHRMRENKFRASCDRTSEYSKKHP
jgi:hypothetical protein